MSDGKVDALDNYEVMRGLCDFFREAPPPLEFILPGFLRKTVGVLVAAGSTGKSFYAIQACMSIAAGRDIFGLFGGAEITAGNVAYVALEDPREVFWSRIYGIGQYLRNERGEEYFSEIEAAMDRVSLHTLYGRGYRPMNPNDLTASDQFRQTIDEVKAQGARFVVIDTYSRFLAGHSEQDNAVASTIVSIVEQLCNETNASALVIHHTNKASQFGGAQGEQGAARGASALTDNARFQLNMWTMPAAEAEKYGLTDEERKSYVFAEATKANHMAPEGKRWLTRGRGGVLLGIDPLPEVGGEGQGRQRGRFDG